MTTKDTLKVVPKWLLARAKERLTWIGISALLGAGIIDLDVLIKYVGDMGKLAIAITALMAIVWKEDHGNSTAAPKPDPEPIQENPPG